jgi:N-acetylneuraminic acid mutarotase
VLDNGQVLIAGGLSGNLTLQTAEILDPSTHAFSSLGNMQVARNQHTATLLTDGKVLLAAGSTDAIYLKSAEVFDPADNSFKPVGTMAVARKSHTETLLPNGQVLFTGGKTESSDSRSAELYNPNTQQFTATGSMIDVRSLHTATLLQNGTVLVAAGRKGATPLKTAEIYDPASGVFTSTGSLDTQRKRHRATLLTNGTVLVEGGASLSNGDPVNEGTPTAEIYNPRSKVWSRVQDMHIGRTEHDATLLMDGNVLVTGGLSAFDTSDLYNAPRRTFSQATGVLEPRQRHIAILLSHPAWGSLVGKVLIIGGAATGNSAFGGIARALDSVEIYDPASREITSFGTMTATRQNHTATMLQDGRILIAGGVDSPVFSGTAELVQP